MRTALLAMVVLLVAGCTGPADADVQQAAVEHSAIGFADPSIAVEQCMSANCYEPTVVADPQGTLFAADATTSPIGVSTDGGQTWSYQAPPPMPRDYSGRQSDVALHMSPGGRLYWSALVVYQPVPGSFTLEGIQVAWSDDAARTWTASVHLSPASVEPFVLAPDRQWLGFAPDGTIYLTYNQIPSGIWFASSHDEGASWSGWTRVAPVEGRLGVGQSGPPVVDSQGVVYVPACNGVENVTASGTRVYRSADGGSTFTSTLVNQPCSWFPMLSVAPDDELVLAVTAGALTVSSSTDGGASFGSVVQWAPGSTTAPWPVALGDGRLALAWYSGDASASSLRVTTGSTSGGPGATTVAIGSMGQAGSRTSAMTDFASMALRPDGSAAVVWVEGQTSAVSVGALAWA